MSWPDACPDADKRRTDAAAIRRSRPLGYVLDSRGVPRARGADAAAPGLRFIGYVPRPGGLGYMAKEAKRAARAIVAELRKTGGDSPAAAPRIALVRGGHERARDERDQWKRDQRGDEVPPYEPAQRDRDSDRDESANRPAGRADRADLPSAMAAALATRPCRPRRNRPRLHGT
jgi:hypothetical protein